MLRYRLGIRVECIHAALSERSSRRWRRASAPGIGGVFALPAAARAARKDCDLSAAICRSSARFSSRSAIAWSSFVRVCGLGRAQSPREGYLHGREVCRGRAGIIDRHQGFVIGLGNQHAGATDAECCIAAKSRSDQAHRQEGDKDRPRIVCAIWTATTSGDLRFRASPCNAGNG